MMLLTLLVLLSTAPPQTPRTKNIKVVLKGCGFDPPKKVFIVVNGDDAESELHPDKDNYLVLPPLATAIIVEEARASLRLGGHRTDCMKASRDALDAALFTFECDRRRAVDVTITVAASESLAVTYERHVSGRQPGSTDCVEQRTILGRQPIMDVRVGDNTEDKENLTLIFRGSFRDRRPGPEMRGFVLPPEHGRKELNRPQLKRELATQRAMATGILAPIAIDVDDVTLKDLTKLTIEVGGNK